MRILIIGATGMLGEPVAKRLRAAGHEIRIMARNPAKARDRFANDFEIVHGEVGDKDAIKAALADCDGVHISLNGGPTAADHDRVEHRGTANIADAAAQTGVRHLTYLSGISARPKNNHFPPTAAKLKAGAAIAASGVPHTIFRPQWFFESLPLFVRHNRAVLLGPMRNRWHWLAVDDYATMVCKAYELDTPPNQALDVIGPEPLSLTEAMIRYCEVMHPGVPIEHLPFWRARVFGFMTGTTSLKHLIPKMQFWDRFEEEADPEPANTLFGAPQTTLDEWLEERTTGT